MEPTQMPINRWTDKENLAYVFTVDFHSAIKKDEIMAFAGKWVEFENIMLSEIKVKDRIFSFICGSYTNKGEEKGGRKCHKYRREFIRVKEGDWGREEGWEMGGTVKWNWPNYFMYISKYTRVNFTFVYIFNALI